MKKLLLLSERLPYPPTSGTKNLLYNYCRIIHDKLGIKIVNISFLEQDEDISTKPDFIERTYTLPNPSGFVKLKNIIFKTLLQRQYPLQVSLFWDPKIKKLIDNIVVKEHPDYVIADFIRTTEYLKDYNGYKIADLQDLLSLRYQRQLTVNIETINPYGAYLYRLPKIMQVILQKSPIKRTVMKTEIKLLKNFETRVGKQYDRVMFVAKKEAALFDQMIGEKKALVAPLGVDYDYFSKDLHVKKIKKSIAFLGALNVAHNENGIIHFIENCMPVILKKIPEAVLYVIGGNASERLKQYESEHVIFTGHVLDVRATIGKCEVFICPLQFGSGIKTKNLEAMAMGMPIITTSIGAENINGINGRDWFIAKDDNSFCDSVINLLNEEEQYKRQIGRNAQKFVHDYFTWSITESALRKVFL